MMVQGLGALGVLRLSGLWRSLKISELLRIHEARHQLVARVLRLTCSSNS